MIGNAVDGKVAQALGVELLRALCAVHEIFSSAIGEEQEGETEEGDDTALDHGELVEVACSPTCDDDFEPPQKKRRRPNRR